MRDFVSLTGLVVTAAAMVSMSGFVWWTIREAGDAGARTDAARAAGVRYQRASFVLARVQAAEAAFAFSPSKPGARDLLAAQHDFVQAVAALRSNAAGAAERTVTAHLARESATLGAGIKRAVAAANAGDAGAIRTLQAGAVGRSIARMRPRINRQISAYGHAATASLAASRSAGARLSIVTVITVLLAAAVTIAVLRMARLRRKLADAHRREVEHLRTAALRDSLTGLRNHRSFREDLVTNAGDQRAGHVLMLDLNGLKATNDKHGHQAGDDLLVKVTAALEHVSEAHTAVPYRIGGDEFAVVVPAAGDPALVAGEIHDFCRRSHPPAPTLTAGHASWAEGVGADELVRRADLALIIAKRDRLTTLGYTAQLEDGPSPHAVERAELRMLLGTPRSIVPVFQPIFDLRSRDIVAYEALTRFPVDAGHSTQEWFELAQRHGLAVELEAAAVQAALAVPGRPAGVSLSLNISPEVLLTGHEALGLPDDLSAITIEVTENALVTEGADLERALHDLRARGARIAVDDAGAGYAGFAQLARVRPDIIKLDRSLVCNVNTDPTKAAVIRAFVGYARDTGALICAEGIETAGELSVVASLGAATGQGFLLARPEPEWLKMPPAIPLAAPEPDLRVVPLRPAASA